MALQLNGPRSLGQRLGAVAGAIAAGLAGVAMLAFGALIGAAVIGIGVIAALGGWLWLRFKRPEILAHVQRARAQAQAHVDAARRQPTQPGTGRSQEVLDVEYVVVHTERERR